MFHHLEEGTYQLELFGSELEYPGRQESVFRFSGLEDHDA